MSDATSDEDRDEAAVETLDRARESLHEYERFDEILSRPFDDCVATIRADLGLAPESDVLSNDADAPMSSDGVKVADKPVADSVTEPSNGMPARRFSGLDPPDTASAKRRVNPPSRQ